MVTQSTINSWYPVAVARNVPAGKIIPFNLSGKEWLLYRGQDGILSAVSRLCPHMGTDLANGKIVGNHVVCIMHSWQFDASGQCTHIPYTTNIPEKACLATLPVLEKFGMVYVSADPYPVYELPEFVALGGKVICSRVKVFELDNPYLAVTLNAFDMQHFYAVHNRIISKPPEVTSLSREHLSIDFNIKIMLKRWVDYVMKTVGFDEISIRIDCWGGNNLYIANLNAGMGGILCLSPYLENKCKLYFVAACQNKTDSGIRKIWNRILVEISGLLTRSFLSPDLRVVKNMHPIEGLTLEKEEGSMRRFWQYWNQLPMTNADV